MESRMIPAENVLFKAISCGKLRRYFDLENFFDFFRSIAGVLQSFWIVLRFNPDVIFCKGGYVSLPVAIGGYLARKPIIIHESDFIPGLANKISARFANVVCVSFKDSAAFFKKKRVVMSGNPVREDLATGSRQKALELTGLSGSKPVILVIGGSQGANLINELIWSNLHELLTNFEIIHLCGAGKMNTSIDKAGYYSMEYASEELKDLLALSNIVISRAGANSLAELAFLKKPAVLIPLVKGSRGDQIANAIEYSKDYPAVILDERKLESEKPDLSALCKELLNKKEGFPTTQNNAVTIITDLILSYAKN